MVPRLVIFDLDGTLLDTVEDVADCFNSALRECGFPERTLEEVVTLVGGDLEAIVGRLLPLGSSQDDVNRVKLSYRRLYAMSDKSKTHPYDGISELLEELRRKGVALAVNTNKGQDLAEKCMSSMFPGMEIPVVGLVEGRPHKPDPFGVKLLLDRFSCSEEETVYVGDGVSDALTARNAGLAFIYCSWGQGAETDVREYSPAMRIANGAQELRELLFEG